MKVFSCKTKIMIVYYYCNENEKLSKEKKMINLTKTLENFRAADKKVTEIENSGGIYQGIGYSGTQTTKEYEEALKEAQKLFAILEQNNINPF